MALAVESNTVIPVWLRTTAGMLVSVAIGITVGIILNEKIPEKQVKWFAAMVFIAFGLWGLYDPLVNGLLKM